jgi:ATP-binding cassette subfamily B protein
MGLFIGLSTLLTIMIGGLQYIKGSTEIGLDIIVEFVIYINMLTFPVSAIGWTASMIQRAAASQKRLNEFLHTVPTIQNNKAPVTINSTGKISFQNVNFVYPNTGIHALKDFNLEISPGEKCAIVGRTGSGKTTVAQLLLRMYDPTSGAILLNNVELKKLDLNNIRSQISYVPQDGFLFSDSVEKNISFGLNEADLERVREAAHRAAIDQDIIGFPKGYQTMVGERGVTLSGGQKQRVSIARALAKNTSVLILDDSLSAVDAKTEKEIFANIHQYMQNKTALVITHKITSLADFDKIVVLEEGSIVEMGRHSELMKKGGIYTEMYLRQQVQRVE